MSSKIKCVSCKFAKPDKYASEPLWTAYECANHKSEYYKSLLNVNHEGEKQYRITWSGCEYGERRVKK